MTKFLRTARTRLAQVAVLLIALLGTTVVAQPAHAGQDSSWPCGSYATGFICLYDYQWYDTAGARYTEDWCGPGWGVKFSIDSWFWDKTSSWKNRQSAGTYANGWDYLGNGKYALLVNFPTYLDSRPYMGDAANRLDTLSNNCS